MAQRGFDIQLELKPELADFMNCDTASRNEITNALWKHIKKHKLQVVGDGRSIDPDETLEPLFGSKRFSMFKIAKMISANTAKIK